MFLKIEVIRSDSARMVGYSEFGSPLCRSLPACSPAFRIGSCTAPLAVKPASRTLARYDEQDRDQIVLNPRPERRRGCGCFAFLILILGPQHYPSLHFHSRATHNPSCRKPAGGLEQLGLLWHLSDRATGQSQHLLHVQEPALPRLAMHRRAERIIGGWIRPSIPSHRTLPKTGSFSAVNSRSNSTVRNSGGSCRSPIWFHSDSLDPGPGVDRNCREAGRV